MPLKKKIYSIFFFQLAGRCLPPVLPELAFLAPQHNPPPQHSSPYRTPPPRDATRARAARRPNSRGGVKPSPLRYLLPRSRSCSLNSRSVRGGAREFLPQIRGGSVSVAELSKICGGVCLLLNCRVFVIRWLQLAFLGGAAAAELGLTGR